MTTLKKLFVLAFIASHVLVSHGFLSHPQKPLPSQSRVSSRIQQPNPANLVLDTKFKDRYGWEQQSVMIPGRRSVANVQTMGLFGLGGAEIAIVLAAVAFIIGPEQLGKMAGSVKGDLPDDLKRIPEEFQKGFEESTENARARNAKQMEAPPDEKGQEE